MFAYFISPFKNVLGSMLMKKVFNWLGIVIIVVYILLVIFGFIFGRQLDANNNIAIRNIIYSFTALLIIAAFALFPFFYDWSLGKLLPCYKSEAILVFKQTSVSHWQEPNGADFTTNHYNIAFDLADGSRRVFKVNEKQWNMLLQGEQGILTYKEQGKHTYFIDFKKQ